VNASRRLLVTAAVALVQLGCVGAAVAPQLSARLAGDRYLVRVAPVDPLDPFRGAYVDLDYPDLRTTRSRGGAGDLFITLRQDGDVWVADGFTRERPEAPAYLACDDRGWQVRCGIESWFLPQDQAAEMERAVGDGAYAEIRVDDRGNAALVDVREAP
jgi:uncharacterized membrane-anchored protein